jgi:hypothetical protein
VVTIPPHIRDDINAHLHQFVAKSDEALLFTPVRGGCHVHCRYSTTPLSGLRKA